jgi:hypothetical protein
MTTTTTTTTTTSTHEKKPRQHHLYEPVANTQNHLLLQNLLKYYSNKEYLQQMTRIINGESKISLRSIDWFVTNYAKKYFTVYDLTSCDINGNTEIVRFKVYDEYKRKLKGYSKRRFDPFCRWERISIPYDDENNMETTIGQLNFFKWAIDHHVLDYIHTHFDNIEKDMNQRNSTSKRKPSSSNNIESDGKTRKKREELSVSACKCFKKENVEIVVKFG